MIRQCISTRFDINNSNDLLTPLSESQQNIQMVAQLSRPGILKCAQNFQIEVVNTYNIHAKVRSDLMFLPISLRDDQTKIGTGLTSIEFAVEASILRAETEEGP